MVSDSSTHVHMHQIDDCSCIVRGIRAPRAPVMTMPSPKSFRFQVHIAMVRPTQFFGTNSKSWHGFKPHNKVPLAFQWFWRACQWWIAGIHPERKQHFRQNGFAIICKMRTQTVQTI
eukprot:5702062-Amphidinium_carterae.1